MVGIGRHTTSLSLPCKIRPQKRVGVVTPEGRGDIVGHHVAVVGHTGAQAVQGPIICLNSQRLPSSVYDQGPIAAKADRPLRRKALRTKVSTLKIVGQGQWLSLRTKGEEVARPTASRINRPLKAISITSSNSPLGIGQ